MQTLKRSPVILAANPENHRNSLEKADFCKQTVSVLKHTAFIKSEAHRLGFDYCGVARAERLEDDARRLEAWLKRGMQGKMQYMENHFDLRIDPSRLVPGARSVITLLKNYFPGEHQSPAAPKISAYAFGKDYHRVIKSKLKELLASAQQEIGAIHGRGFVDSAPLRCAYS